LDMNGNDITFESNHNISIDNASLTLKDEGTITANGRVTIHCRGSLFVEDYVTIDGNWDAIVMEGDTDAERVNISGGTFNARGEGVNFYFSNEHASVTITGGTFSCDPSEYVDTENYSVTYNNDGTWTVSCNHNGSTHTNYIDFGNGTHGYTCTVCGKILNEKHSLKFTDIGEVTHTLTCTVCDSHVTEKHSYDENSECNCGAENLLVTTPNELLAAIEKGKHIKLGADIALDNTIYVESNVTIDLNEKTLSCNSTVLCIQPAGTVSISNGNIVSDGGTLINCGTLFIDNCTVTDATTALTNSEGLTNVTNSTLNGAISNYDGTMTLYEGVTLGVGTVNDYYVGLASYGGSIVCHFDPGNNLFTAYGNFDVTNNGDGTWTVTKAE